MLLLAGILALTAVGGVLRYADTALVALFFVSLAALAGLAWAITFSTEALSARLGAAATGVLQATLGNNPELSVVLFALHAGENVFAQTSLLGAGCCELLAAALAALAHIAPSSTPPE